MSALNSNPLASGEVQISFAMACFNAQPFLREAIQSALNQRDVTVEVLVVDDGSADNSVKEAREMADADPRVRVFQTPVNGGPAAARNLALEQMRGQWFAILDSDDLIDAQRSSQLLNIAEVNQADLIADNLLVFGEGIMDHSFLSPEENKEGRWLSLEEYFVRSQLFAKRPGLGFLKPMIRKSALERHGIRYNEGLRIGEDDELIVQLLHVDCRYYLNPTTGYKYRKHGNSISHRLSVENAERMLAAERQIRQMIGDVADMRAYKNRFHSIARGAAFVRSIEQLKEKRVLSAIRTLLSNPAAIPLYQMPIAAKVKRILGQG